MNSTKSTVIKVVVWVIVIALVAGVIAIVYRYTNGFNETFKTFYVEYQGEKILASNNSMALEAGKTHRFDVKYVFDGADQDGQPRDYNVNILPNEKADFDFTVNGESYSYAREANFNKSFGLNKQDSYFELVLKEGLTLQMVLKEAHPGGEVELPTGTSEVSAFPYKLVVSSYNENVVYNITFAIAENVTGVVLNPSEIVFTGTGQTGGDATLPNNPVTPDETPDVAEPDDSTTTPEVPPVPSEPKEQYYIDLDCLGNGGLSALDVVCPNMAAAGDVVAFTAVLNAFGIEEGLELTGIALNDGDSGEDIQRFNVSASGEYSFVMPEGNVVIMFYLMTV